jgi:hypothetical protein
LTLPTLLTNHKRRLGMPIVPTSPIRCIVAIGVLFAGCAASRALNQPDKKDYAVLAPGTHVDMVRAELGEPLKSGLDRCDLFVFQEGSSGWKYLRAMGYSILDIGTLALSEIVTNPLEASVGSRNVRMRVCYDAEQNVAYSERLDIGKSPQLITGSYPVRSQTIR